MIARKHQVDVQIRRYASLRQKSMRCARAKRRWRTCSRTAPAVYLLDELRRLTPRASSQVDPPDPQVKHLGWAASNERVSDSCATCQNNGRYVERPELIEIKIASRAPGHPASAVRVFVEFQHEQTRTGRQPPCKSGRRSPRRDDIQETRA